MFMAPGKAAGGVDRGSHRVASLPVLAWAQPEGLNPHP